MASLRILLITSREEDVLFFEERLSSAYGTGYELTVRETSAAGLAEIEHCSICFVRDTLPDGDSLGFIEEVSRQNKLVPLVVVIDTDSNAVVLEHRTAGANYVLALRRQGESITAQDLKALVSYAFQDYEERILARELTTRTRLQHTILEQVSDAIIVTDKTDMITSWNKGAEGIYGWQETEVVGESIRILRTRFLQPNAEQLVRQAIKESGHWSGEVIQRHKDGTEIRIFCSMTQLHDADGSLSGQVAVNRDITEWHQLRNARLALEQEKQRSKLIRELMSNIAHDFRTPLTAITTEAFLVKRRMLQSGSSDARQLQGIDRLMQQISHLTHMLTTTLELVELDLETDPLVLSQALLNPLVREIAEQFRIEFPDHELELNLDEKLPRFWFDPSKMSRALGEIISNAFRYTSRGGTITVSTRLMETGSIEILVADTGIGIAQEQLPHIFERFYRVDAVRAMHQGGGGLGLSLAKVIVELHNGSIGVESDLGEGSTFRIILPKSSDAAE